MLVGTGRGCEFGNIQQLDVPEEPEQDPGWWQVSPASKQRESEGKGCLCIDIPQDRSQRVPLTSRVTPPAPGVPLQELLAPGKCLPAEALAVPNMPELLVTGSLQSPERKTAQDSFRGETR